MATWAQALPLHLVDGVAPALLPAHCIPPPTSVDLPVLACDTFQRAIVSSANISQTSFLWLPPSASTLYSGIRYLRKRTSGARARNQSYTCSLAPASSLAQSTPTETVAYWHAAPGDTYGLSMNMCDHKELVDVMWIAIEPSHRIDIPQIETRAQSPTKKAMMLSNGMLRPVDIEYRLTPIHTDFR
ncbi:hypothetical protein VTO73DRAFT_14044 [Trametes versicolor]